MLSRILNITRAHLVRFMSRNRHALCDMPRGLYDYWARTAPREFVGIPTDAFFYARASDTLLAFFECIQHSKQPCALPSKAADSVWHAWLRYAPADLDAFCERHFGRRIPHVEAGAMAGGMALPLAACLVAARQLEGLPPAGPELPRLLLTDRQLRMPRGFAYRLEDGHPVYSHISARGEPLAVTYQVAAGVPAFLLAAGLIGEDDYEAWLYRSRHAERNSFARDASGGTGNGRIAAGDGGVGVGGCGDSAGDACDGGSSCGTSCGGGCGGGCGGD